MENFKLQKVGKEVIKFEINALKSLNNVLNKNFTKIINLILSCKSGKVIISGVGKSGIIARKWAATFSSTVLRLFF